MRYLVLVLALCPLAGRTYGQTGVPLPVGQRVWVRTATASGRLDAGVKGTLEEVTRDSLRVRPPGAGPAVSVWMGAQTQVFVFTGRRSSAGRGAAIGGGVGVLAGAVMGFAGGEDCSRNEFLCFDRGSLAAAGAVALGGVGLIGGLIVGALSSHDTWARLESRAAVGPIVAPSRRGIGLGLSVSF